MIRRTRALLALPVVAIACMSLVVPAAPASAIPSEDYCPSPIQILDGDAFGIRNKVVVQQSGTQVALCVRFEAATASFGGALVIGGVDTLTIPPVDLQGASCSTVHVNQTIATQHFVLATGGAPGETWVCIQGPGVSLRMIVDWTPASVMWHDDFGRSYGTDGLLPIYIMHDLPL